MQRIASRMSLYRIVSKLRLLYWCLCSLLIVSALILFSACETVIDIDPPDYDSQLNIISKFSQDSLWAARVMRTIPIGNQSDSSAIFLTDATVMLYQGDILVDQLEYDGVGDGWYVSSMGLTPKLETPYRLVVEAPGFDPVFAESEAPPAPILADVSLEVIEPYFAELDPEYKLKFAIKNPPGLNYFNFSIYAGTSEVGTLGFVRYNLASFNMRHDTRQWYCYYHHVLNPLEVDSDLGGGQVCQIAILSDRALENQELLTFNIEGYPVLYNVVPDLDGPPEWTHIILVVQALSPEFVEYSGSLEQQTDNDGFSEPRNVFSNVDGGHGIFAGYSVTYWVSEIASLESE
ncbi:MAG: DUF4249 family protein [Bacteroidetes bacterium]|nr:DUF4249 family protein [Bacteroidota bacterium]